MISSPGHLVNLIPCAVMAALLISLPVCHDAIAADLKAESAAAPILSPGSVVASPDRGTLYVACETAARIAVVNLASGTTTRTMPTPDAPMGLVISNHPLGNPQHRAAR